MKSAASHERVQTFGLFEKRLEGDDSLLELARFRFQQFGLNAEMPAAGVGQLEAGLRFRPQGERPVMVHLAREWNLSEPDTRRRLVELAARFAGQVHGFVLHDHPDLSARPEVYESAARELDLRLQGIERCPWVFIEYAAGLEPQAFGQFFESIVDLAHLSACIDVGHVGIRQSRQAFALAQGGLELCALKDKPSRWPPLLDDIARAVQSALPEVLRLVEAIGSLHKPMHFHLHDGHPLSTFSPFGVSDHLSFFNSIPLPFEYRGVRSLPLMYGPAGLGKIIRAARAARLPALSLTLEIHPAFEEAPLGDGERFFGHWVDKTNARKMNHWLQTLGANHALVREALESLAPR